MGRLQPVTLGELFEVLLQSRVSLLGSGKVPGLQGLTQLAEGLADSALAAAMMMAMMAVSGVTLHVLGKRG